MQEQCPTPQNKQDLENARRAVDEATKPVVDEMVASMGGFVLQAAEKFTYDDAHAHVIGNEAQTFLDSGMRSELAAEAAEFLGKGSAEEIANDATLWLAHTDHKSGKGNALLDMGTPSFKQMRKEYKGNNSSIDGS